MALVVQLILGVFMSLIKVKSRDGHIQSGVKVGYIGNVMRLDNGFHKTVEKVMCRRSHTLAPILQMHMHKFIRTNSYAPIHTHQFIRTRVYAQSHSSKLNARQCKTRTKCFPHCSHLRYL